MNIDEAERIHRQGQLLKFLQEKYLSSQQVRLSRML